MRAQLWSLRRRTRSSLPLCTPIRGRYWTRCRVPIRVAFETASLLAKYQASFHRRPAAAFMGDAPMRCRNAAWTSQSYVRRRRGVSLPAISTDLPERSLALSDKAPTMTDTELLFMSATRAAALIRRKKLSPVEYVDAALSAAERLQPKLNCFMTITGDQAREAAKAAERAVMTGERRGALHGIPVGVKDLLPTKGVRTTFGSVAFADHVPDRDDVLVTRLRAAGAIMIGKTTTPEFGIKGQTQPVGSRTHAGWIERRRGSRGRCWHRPHRARQRRRRIDPYSRRLLWLGRPKRHDWRHPLSGSAGRFRKRHRGGAAYTPHRRLRDDASRSRRR